MVTVYEKGIKIFMKKSIIDSKKTLIKGDEKGRHSEKKLIKGENTDKVITNTKKTIKNTADNKIITNDYFESLITR